MPDPIIDLAHPAIDVDLGPDPSPIDNAIDAILPLVDEDPSTTIDLHWPTPEPDAN